VNWRGPAAGAAERWPAWFAALGFALAFVAAAVTTGVIAGVAAALGADIRDGTPALTIASTLAFDTAFIGVAWLLASHFGQITVRPADFALTRLPLRRAAGWTLAAIAGWYAFALSYAALIPAEGEQDTLDALGANEGLALLLTATLLVVVVAPFAEEIFFRGFCYRALRNRFGRWTAAAIVGVVFGSIHFTGPDTLPLLPPLAVLGILFCLLYERTGSLYPAIALHIVNNAVALAITAEASAAPVVAAVAATAALAGVATIGRARS